MDRKEYFHHLLSLQAELIKLQDWVQRTGEKIVVIFEGRDAAGKGGVIKRITHAPNPLLAITRLNLRTTHGVGALKHARGPTCRKEPISSRS